MVNELFLFYYCRFFGPLSLNLNIDESTTDDRVFTRTSRCACLNPSTDSISTSKTMWREWERESQTNRNEMHCVLTCDVCRTRSPICAQCFGLFNSIRLSLISWCTHGVGRFIRMFVRWVGETGTWSPNSGNIRSYHVSFSICVCSSTSIRT